MRTIQAQDLKVLAAPARADFLVVEVLNTDGAWVDLTALAGRDWVVDVTWGQTDVDTPVTQCTVNLWRNEYFLSLAGLRSDSKLNRNAAGAYAPLLDLGRGIRLRARVWPRGYAPRTTDLEEYWHGLIQSVDDYASEDTVQVVAHDLGAQIRDAFIEAERTYGSDAGVPMENVAQAILTDNVVSAPLTLYCPVSPSFNITPAYTQQQVSALEAETTLAALRGWTFQYNTWNPATSAWAPTLKDPNRSNTTAAYTFAKTVYTGTRFLRDITNVRNAIEVSYVDAADGVRKSVVVTDAASISKYGRRYGKVSEPDNSPIDNPAEATTFANAMLSDLKDPKAELAAIVDWHPWVEMGDVYTFAADGVAYTADQTLAVVGYEHHYSGGKGSTTLQLRGAPAGAYQYWLRRIVPDASDSLARIEIAVPSYDGTTFAVRVEANERAASLWVQETAVSLTWNQFSATRFGTFSDVASTSTTRVLNFAAKNTAGELGPTRQITIDRFYPSTNNLQCLARVTGSTATTVTVTVTCATAGAQIVYTGISGGAGTLASGPAIGVPSVTGTAWTFTRGAINTGTSQAAFAASASGYVSDTAFAPVDEQGRDTVPLLCMAGVQSTTSTQVVVRVRVADPYPSATVTLTYTSVGTGTVSPASGQTVAGASITTDVTTSPGYVDFTVQRGVGNVSGRVTFVATAAGRTQAVDAIDVACTIGAPPVWNLVQTADTTLSETWTLSGAPGTGGAAPVQVQVEDAVGSVLTAWTGVPLSRTFIRSATQELHYRLRLRDSSSPAVEADVYDLPVHARTYFVKQNPTDPNTVDGIPDGTSYRRTGTGYVDASGRVINIRDAGRGVDVTGDQAAYGFRLQDDTDTAIRINPVNFNPGALPAGMSAVGDFSVGGTNKFPVGRHGERSASLKNSNTLSFRAPYAALPLHSVVRGKGSVAGSGNKEELTLTGLSVNGATVRAVEVVGSTSTARTDYPATTLNGTPNPSGISLSTSGSTAAYINLSNANATGTTYTVYYDCDTTGLPAAGNEYLLVEAYYNAGAASTTWALGAQDTHLQGEVVTGATLSFNVSLGANYDVRFLITKVHVSGVAGGTATATAKRCDYAQVTAGTENSLTLGTDDYVVVQTWEATSA